MKGIKKANFKEPTRQVINLLANSGKIGGFLEETMVKLECDNFHCEFPSGMTDILLKRLRSSLRGSAFNKKGYNRVSKLLQEQFFYLRIKCAEYGYDAYLENRISYRRDRLKKEIEENKRIFGEKQNYRIVAEDLKGNFEITVADQIQLLKRFKVSFKRFAEENPHFMEDRKRIEKN